MIRKWAGAVALTILIGSITYSYDPAFWAWGANASSAPVQSQLAQTQTATAPTQSTSSEARTECKGGETLTVTVGADGVKSSGTCNLPKTNTCKVIVNSPDKPAAVVTKCCNPEDGSCMCPNKGVSCDTIFPMKSALQQALSPYKYKCTQSSKKNSSVRVESQLAQASAASAEAEPINCEDLNKRLSGSSRPPASTGAQTPPAPASTDAQTPPASVVQTPTQQRPEINNAYQGEPRPTTQTLQTQPAQTDAYRQIQQQGGTGYTGAAPGQTGQQALPVQTQPQAAPGGPAFEQGRTYRTMGANPTGGNPSGYTRGSYDAGLRGQNTFGNGNFMSSRSGARVAASFISGLASLIGGLFSVPTNNVVNYVQSFVGGTSPQRTPASQNPGQGQAQEQGQVIVVVPYPMPTSARGDILAQLPPPPTSTRDTYADIRELADRTDNGRGVLISGGTQDDRFTSAFSGEEQARPGPGPTVSTGLRGGVRATPTPRQNELSLDRQQMGTTSRDAGGEEATSTHATTTSYKEPEVVEVGIPVDITDLGSYESVLAYLRGDWARTKHTALQNKVALAQAQAQQEAIRAQIEALQDARAADLCDESCAAALTVLENELPVLRSRVEELQTAVEKDAKPRLNTPPPTVGQIQRVAESLAEPTYKAEVPRSASAAPSEVSVAEQEAQPEVPETKGEAVVKRVVQSIWNFLKSIFLPPTDPAAKPRASCSLIASLFGKCK